MASLNFNELHRAKIQKLQLDCQDLGEKLTFARTELYDALEKRRAILADDTIPQRERQTSASDLNITINFLRSDVSEKFLAFNAAQRMFSDYNSEFERELELQFREITPTSEQERERAQERERELQKITPASQEEADALLQVAISVSEQYALEQAEAVLQVKEFEKAEREKRATDITEVARQMINDGADPVDAYLFASEIFRG